MIYLREITNIPDDGCDITISLDIRFASIFAAILHFVSQIVYEFCFVDGHVELG